MAAAAYWSELAAQMRAAGVRRLLFASDGCLVTEIELEPAPLETIPAPAPFELEDTQPDKPAGTCVDPDCNERGGFHLAPQYCERHGLGGLGVKT